LGKPVVHWSLRTYLTQQDLPGNPRTGSNGGPSKLTVAVA
jgi:hypothetical protein